MGNKTKTTLKLLILFSLISLNAFAQDEPYMKIVDMDSHKDFVSSSIAFHPDGNIIVSAGTHGIRLWDANTGKVLKTLTGDTWGASHVAFSPDGDTIVSVHGIVIRLWDANTGELRKTLSAGLIGFITSIAFHPNDNIIASSHGAILTYNDDGTVDVEKNDFSIRLWDTNTGELLKTLTGHTELVSSVAFHSDGNTIVSSSSHGFIWYDVGTVDLGNDDFSIRLWDTNTGEQLKTLKTSSAYNVAFWPDENTIVSSHVDRIRLWDRDTGKILKTHSGPGGFTVAFSPDQQTIASNAGTIIFLWDAKTGERLKTLARHTLQVSSVAFHPDGNIIASSGWDNTILLWHVDTAESTPDDHSDTLAEATLPTVSLSESSSTVAPGETFTLDATLENIDEISAVTTLQFYGPVKVVRTDHQKWSGMLPTIDFTDKPLGEEILIVRFITTDSTEKQSLTVTAPETDGTYAYMACIEQIDGAGETIKACSDVITVEVAATDLHVRVWTESKVDKVWTKTTTVAPGKEFKLAATVKNAGGKSDKTALWFYLQNDDTKPAKGLGGFQIDPLPMADGTTMVTKHISVTAPETPGTYTYTASVDSVEGEENTDNNSAEITITVGVPDLAIMSMSASDTELRWNRDAPISTQLSVTIKNIGTVKSDSTHLHVYRSANQHISEYDTVVRNYYPVKALNPQEEVTLEFPTTVEEKAHPDPEIADPPTIYYYGVSVDSPSDEINSDNNWSKDIVRVYVTEQSVYALDVQPNFISEVAYSNGYTYFLLTAQFLKLRRQDSEDDPGFDYDNKQCTIRLHLPPASKSDQPLDNPAYFMLPIEIPRDQLSNIAKEGGKGVFKSVIFTALGELAGLVVKSVGGIFFASFTIGWQVGELIVDYTDTQAEAEAQTPTVNLNDPEKAQLCFLIVRGRLKNVEISVIQKVKQEGNDHLFTALYRNTWNLEETYRLENPDLAAAPDARTISLTDFPLFQHLPPELQAYILQYFGEIANPNTLNPERLQIPEETSVLPNYPNPFNPETWIPYQLAAPGDVNISIYAADGQLVRKIALGRQTAGIYQNRNRAAHWDGRNSLGEPVASGVYFYTLRAGEFTATRKMLIRK